MKQKKSAVNLIAGIVFLYMVYLSVRFEISIVIQNGIIDGLSGLIRYFYSPMGLLTTIYRFALLLTLAIFALRQKKRGRILNILTIIDIVLQGIGLLSVAAYRLNIWEWLNLAVYIAAFAVTGKAGGSALFPAEDNVSEAAKAKMQAEKQNAMYAEQLKSGILTQEEYNQIMENKI